MPKADINAAYDKFSTILKSYNDKNANFMKDGVFIANSNGENGVKGLRSQGFVLNLAAVLYDDSLHLCYENGDKAVDLFFIPALNKIEVMPYGFDKYHRHQQPTKIFNVSGGIEKFAEFIESLPDYKVDENRQCSMSKKIESLKKTHEANGPTDCCPQCGTKAGAPEVSFEGNRIYTEYFCENCWAKWHLESVFKKMVVTSVPNERKTRR